MVHEICDDLPGLCQTGWRFGTDALLFDGAMPSFDLPVGLWIEGGCSHMRHPTNPDKRLEFLGDKLGTIVGDDPRSDPRKEFPGSLDDDLDIGFGHPLADLPVHDVPAIPIQNRTQVVEGSADIDVGDIHVPVLVRAGRLVEAFPLSGGRL